MNGIQGYHDMSIVKDDFSIILPPTQFSEPLRR